MVDLISPANFEFFARYLLAGWIIMSIRSRYAVGERSRLGDYVFEAVVLSLVNQLLFQALVAVTGLVAPLTAAPAKALFFVEILLLPVLLGLVAGANLAKGWNRAFLRRLSMPVQTPVRRAYDHAFAENSTPRFVILTYEDGTSVHGFFGENSLAANDATRSDIYLERLYDVGDDGQWYEKLARRAGLLMIDGLRSLEFLMPEEDQYDQNRPDASD